jgi:Ser/Thr protein kinase RdoA (MazF antagonist)
MPPDAVARCRAAWQPLANEPRSVIHGDPGADNIRIASGGVGLLDWDEARVDAAILDLAQLPVDLPAGAPAWLGPLTAERLAAARTAADAWEAANAWLVEPAYARRRLADLMATAAAGGTDAREGGAG